jgi:dipeptide/tripeptide permease
MSAWTSSQNKALGWYYFVVASAGIIAAFLTQPVGEWGGWGVAMAAALAALALVGIYQGITGKGNTRSRAMSERRQRSVSIFGLVFLTLAVGALVLGDAGQWTAVDTLSLAIWIALGGMFISQIVTLGKGD